MDIPKLGADADKSLRASPACCKAVLKEIDDYGRGRAAWPSQETLAYDTSFSERQVIKAIARMQAMGILAVDTRKLPGGKVGNLYSIVWSELAVRQQVREQRFEPRRRDRSELASPHQPDRSELASLRYPERSELAPDRSELAPDRSELASPKPTRSVKEPPPNREVAAEDFEISEQLRSAGLAHWRSLADEFAGRVDDVQLAVQTWRANRARIGPAAIVWFLRNGAWPEEGLTDTATAAAARSALAARREREAGERREFLAYREARTLGRASAWSAEQVDQHAQQLLEAN